MDEKKTEVTTKAEILAEAIRSLPKKVVPKSAKQMPTGRKRGAGYTRKKVVSKTKKAKKRAKAKKARNAARLHILSKKKRKERRSNVVVEWLLGI